MPDDKVSDVFLQLHTVLHVGFDSCSSDIFLSTVKRKLSDKYI